MFHSTLLVYQNVFTISLYFTIKIKIKHYQLLFMNQFHIISPSLLCVYPICPPPGVRSKPPWTSTVGSSSGSSSSPPEDPIKYQQKILGIEQHGSVKRHGKTMNFTSWKSMLQTLQCLHSSLQVITELISRTGCFKLKTNKSRSSAPVFSSMVIHPSPPSMSSSLFSCRQRERLVP